VSGWRHRAKRINLACGIPDARAATITGEFNAAAVAAAKGKRRALKISEVLEVLVNESGEHGWTFVERAWLAWVLGFGDGARAAKPTFIPVLVQPQETRGPEPARQAPDGEPGGLVGGPYA
jgi:hypothetical protein